MQPEITEELMEQTYLFCYKRLGNPEDARDLAQDILCEALQGLASGREIYHFQSWYWKLARNRYAVLMNHRNHQPTECPIEDYMDQLMFISDSVVDKIALEEDLSRMHAAISRLSKLHREILVQYYIKEQPVSAIANHLNIPEGTVKRRLFDARHQVRERMEKMPNVTELSYAPHELELWMSQGISGIQSFQDLLGKQVLVCCYPKAQSANEISERIQVAPVYIEDKLIALEQAGVLKKAGNKKYLTNFIIFSKNRVTEMLREMDPVYMEISEKVYEQISKNWDVVTEIGFYGTHLPISFLNYVFLCFGIECFGECCVNIYRQSRHWKGFNSTQTDNFGESSKRIMGQMLPAGEKPVDYQIHALDCGFRSKRIDTVDGQVFLVADKFCCAPFPEERIHKIHGNNVGLLYALSRNPRKKLTENEEVIASNLLEQGILKKKPDGYFPNLVIMESEQLQKVYHLFCKLLQPLAEMYFEKLVEKVDRYLLPEVRGDLVEQYYNYVMDIFLIPESSMLWWGKENGMLGLQEDVEQSMAGVLIQHKQFCTCVSRENERV